MPMKILNHPTRSESENSEGELYKKQHIAVEIPKLKPDDEDWCQVDEDLP